MGFDTLVVNGRVVTATDTYPSDIAINGGKIEAIGKSLPRENTKKIIESNWIPLGKIEPPLHT